VSITRSAVRAAVIFSFGLAAAGIAGLALAACGRSGTGASEASGASAASGASGRTLVHGGTAYFAEQPLSPPDYIFPLISDEYYSVANTAEFQTLLYRPLYWYGDAGKPGVDYRLSLADAPVYSDHDRTVTITIKRARWSTGAPVDARDVIFWINLLKANRIDWASYVPGGFPDNVTSWRAVGERTVRLRLNRSYNPIWFTDNELSQITPLPLNWDVTSLQKPAAPPAQAAMPRLPDTFPAGARAVYRFLNAQAKDVSTYATSPIWSVVDGPWKLSALTADGEATFVPNRRYEGPDRPRLARFIELPFTSETSEFSVIESGPADGGGAAGGGGGGTSTAPQISVGYVPDADVPQAASLKRRGYHLIEFYPYGFDYFEPNFNNPTVGPILKQLYFRQAFQHLVNQTGWIHAFYAGLGVPTYSPVPALPANPYADRAAAIDPYPFSVARARALLRAHGWRVQSGGLTACVTPGTGAGECGAGIARGEGLKFTLLYPAGMSSTDNSMADLQAVARQAGIEITLREVSIGTIDSDIEPCTPHQAACSWQLGQYGAAWVFAPDHYPTGEEIFQTGALGNVNNYSNAAVDRLILATTRSSAAAAQAALDAYANRVRVQLPDFWQPSPGTLITVQSNLRGVVPNAYGFINPEEWYFTK
jgi:peptide/nickel transport system substrate-binding protein